MADGTLEYLPTVDGLEHPLGRSVVWHDPRNRAHRALDVLPKVTDGRSLWWTRDVYDQQGSSCTMQAAAGVMATSPFRLDPQVRQNLQHWDTEQERHAGYLRAQRLDPWPGGEDHTPFYEGSSTDAPFKLLRELGHIAGWAWYFGIGEIIEGLRTRGAVSVGTKWNRQMFYPRQRSDGSYVYEAGDRQVVGGHARRWVGYDPEAKEFDEVNSWGRGFGRQGRVRVPLALAEELVADQGEAATIVLHAT